MSLAKSQDVMKIELDWLLDELKLDMAQFVDMCILCGCDYTKSIYGIGTVTAYKIIQKYKSIEDISKHE